MLKRIFEFCQLSCYRVSFDQAKIMKIKQLFLKSGWLLDRVQDKEGHQEERGGHYCNNFYLKIAFCSIFCVCIAGFLHFLNKKYNACKL